jgi:hypothetical protein
MAHFPKPYFRSSRRHWYVQIDGHEHTLGADKDAAFKSYHALMQRRGMPQAQAQKLIVVLIDAFLDFVEKHRNPHTYRWYKDRLQALSERSRPTWPLISSKLSTSRSGLTAILSFPAARSGTIAAPLSDV